MTPTYRERLRREGLALAGIGVVGSAGVLVLTEESKRWPLSTIGQLAIVVGLLALLGPRSIRKAIDNSVEIGPGEEGSGEPTPLWHLPPLVAWLSAVPILLKQAGASRAGWDATLRVTAACALVGLAQALLLARAVEQDEREHGRRYYRMKGSRLGRGTRLGWVSTR